MDFVQTLANMAQVSPQSIVLQHVDVRTFNERNCAQMTLSALGETGMIVGETCYINSSHPRNSVNKHGILRPVNFVFSIS